MKPKWTQWTGVEVYLRGRGGSKGKKVRERTFRRFDPPSLKTEEPLLDPLQKSVHLESDNPQVLTLCRNIRFPSLVCPVTFFFVWWEKLKLVSFFVEEVLNFRKPKSKEKSILPLGTSSLVTKPRLRPSLFPKNFFHTLKIFKTTNLVSGVLSSHLYDDRYHRRSNQIVSLSS